MTRPEELIEAGFSQEDAETYRQLVDEAGMSEDDAIGHLKANKTLFGKATEIRKERWPWEDSKPYYPGKAVLTTGWEVAKNAPGSAIRATKEGAEGIAGLLGLTKSGREGWGNVWDFLHGGISTALSDEDVATESPDEKRQRAVFRGAVDAVGNKLRTESSEFSTDPHKYLQDSAEKATRWAIKNPAEAYYAVRGPVFLGELAKIPGAKAVGASMDKVEPLTVGLKALKQVPTIPSRVNTARAVTGGFKERPLETLDALLSGVGYDPTKITEGDLSRFLGMMKINRSKGHMDTPYDVERLERLAKRMYHEDIPNSMPGQALADDTAAALHRGSEDFLQGRAQAGDTLGFTKDIVGSTKGLNQSPPDMSHLKPRFKKYAEQHNELVTDPARPAFNRGLHNRSEAAKRSMSQEDLLDPKDIAVDLLWNEKQGLYRKARHAGAYEKPTEQLAREIEFNKTLAESILDAIVKKYPDTALADAGAREGELIDLARIIRDAMYKSGKTDLVTLKDSVLGAEWLANPSAMNPALWAVLGRKITSFPEVKGWIARKLYRSRNPHLYAPRLEQYAQKAGLVRAPLQDYREEEQSGDDIADLLGIGKKKEAAR